ncbi:MAG TPA: NADPH:quinone reductase, partial [Steroidobacteraceae bacterium]|nr:NADPH:quinone reductase [Steroidobacteraceae bacterium]
MPRAIRFHEYGGPEVLRFEEVEVGKPAADEAQIRHTAIGLNYIDVYDRTGLYPGELPSGLG